MEHYTAELLGSWAAVASLSNFKLKLHWPPTNGWRPREHYMCVRVALDVSHNRPGVSSKRMVGIGEPRRIRSSYALLRWRAKAAGVEDIVRRVFGAEDRKVAVDTERI